MARKLAKKKTYSNGLQGFSLHTNAFGSKATISALLKERASSPRFAFGPGVTAQALDPETIARAYLQQTLASKAAPSFTAPVVAKVESEFKTIGTEAIPLTGTTTVKFRQTLNKIPVYGALVTV